jgi:hypothetical protein
VFDIETVAEHLHHGGDDSSVPGKLVRGTVLRINGNKWGTMSWDVGDK